MSGSMSRLEKKQKKQFIATVFLVIVVIGVLFIFLFTFGLRLLLNASTLIARFSQNKNSAPTLEKNKNFIGDVDIDDIPAATNSAKILVGGSVVNFSTLEFYLNGDMVRETSLVSSDNFQEEIEPLQKGENEVYVIAKSDRENEEKKSKTFTVVYKDEKPTLEINTPKDGLKTNEQELRISGSTDRETYVKVNDLPVVVDAVGNFQTSVRLKDGENLIKIVASDFAANAQEKTITVFYQKD